MTPPCTTRALLLRHIKSLAGSRATVELRQRDLAPALALSKSQVKHAMRDLTERGVLNLLDRGFHGRPSVYAFTYEAPKLKRKRVVAPKSPVVKPAPVFVATAPAPRPDNPVKKVAPGTYAVRGFTMLRRDAR